MDRDMTEIFPAGPDHVALYPAAGQQRVLAALREDVAAGRYLLCLTGPSGSGKTVLLRALRQDFKQGLVGLIEKPTPGRLLIDVARALQLNIADDNESVLRRHLVMILSMADKQHKPIIQIVDEADRLSAGDLDLLMHFFPSGHATLVFAGVGSPDTWLAAGATRFGSAVIDRTYRLEPLSADETAGYIRHRLREAAAPEDLFQPAAIAAIHRRSGGLPGLINQRCAEAFTQTGVQGKDSVAASMPALEPEPAFVAALEPAPATQAATDLPASTPDEGGTTEVATAPAIEPARRDVPPVQPTPAAPEIEAKVDTAAGPARSLRHSARPWGAIAILVSVMLAIVLTKDAWIDRIPFDRAMPDRLAAPPAEPPAANPSAHVPDQPMATSSPDTQEGPEAPNDAGQNPDFAKPPPSSLSAGTNSSGSALIREPATPPPAAEPAPSPAPPADAPITAVPPVLEDAGTTGATADPAAPVSVAPGSAMSDSVAESPPLTRAQRAEIARLYAIRAEYEWRKGDLDAASVSIQRGLSTDPRNPGLLEMRARLGEAMNTR